MINLNSSSEEEMKQQQLSSSSIVGGDYSTGLPSIEDLTPLSQSLIPFQLASAFKITQQTPKTMSDVTKASNSTFSSLNFNFNPPGPINPLPDPKRIRPGSDEEEEDTDQPGNNNNSSNKSSAKRPRLVWTPQLHKRFVEVVAHLGLKNAVPKTIMQLMNVEGLTRENVASHLQKYRLYVKRMQENDDDDSSNHHPSDNLFASTPIPRGQGFSESFSGHGNNNNHNNNSNNNNNNNSSSSNGGNHNQGEMQMPNMGGFYEGGNGSLHHHHHYHHHYQQQQYGGGGGNMGQQQSNYGNNVFSHHLAQK